MMNCRTAYPLIVLTCLSLVSCDRQHEQPIAESSTSFTDTTFWQEYHEAWKISDDPQANDIQSIAIDDHMNVWVATYSGIFMKGADGRIWNPMLEAQESGPAFSVVRDQEGNIWASTWNGVFRFRGQKAEKLEGPESPVAKLCSSVDGMYALGPTGVWLYDSTGWQKKDILMARSVRDAVSEVTGGGIWVATDVGLYYLKDDTVDHFVDKNHIVSAYVRGVAVDHAGKLWAGGLGGVSILHNGKAERKLSVGDGIPSVQVNAVACSPNGVMWLGTDKGVVRYKPERSSPSLLFSRRWLLNDRVNDITFDKAGNAWVATAGGVSAIKRKRMTLESKALYFYDVLMRRHIREPWIAGQCKLPVPGDTSVWLPDDDDNDGEYTGNYLAMESFRYAVTKDPQARENARKAFRFLKYLQEVTGTKGFFARTIVPSDWREVDDANRVYTKKELAYELVKEPRFKPVEVRWHLSEDGRWLWKGDTSSDEMGGHMMGYFFYYELAADEHERGVVRDHIQTIVDELIRNDYNLVDVDGTKTRWGVWSPSLLNDDPEWMPDRNLNSMELLSFLKLAYYVTGDSKYEDAYRNLISERGYLDNMARIPEQNPGWFIYFDVMLAAYQYPVLLKCEKDPELLAFYQRHIDAWFDKYQRDDNPLINFIYCYARDRKEALAPSISFLQDTPLDLIDWPIDHTQREDIRIVRYPVLDELQVEKLPPASIRGTIRWDKNPYGAISGNPAVEREPVFWLLPYWMGRYLEMIKEPHH